MLPSPETNQHRPITHLYLGTLGSYFDPTRIAQAHDLLEEQLTTTTGEILYVVDNTVCTPAIAQSIDTFFNINSNGLDYRQETVFAICKEYLSGEAKSLIALATKYPGRIRIMLGTRSEDEENRYMKINNEYNEANRLIRQGLFTKALIHFTEAALLTAISAEVHQLNIAQRLAQLRINPSISTIVINCGQGHEKLANKLETQDYPVITHIMTDVFGHEVRLTPFDGIAKVLQSTKPDDISELEWLQTLIQEFIYNTITVNMSFRGEDIDIAIADEQAKIIISTRLKTLELIYELGKKIQDATKNGGTYIDTISQLLK